MEVEVPEKDLAFISPYIVVVSGEAVVEQPQPVKRGRKPKQKNELD